MFHTTTNSKNRNNSGSMSYFNNDEFESSPSQKIFRTGFDGPAPIDFFSQSFSETGTTQLATANNEEEIQEKSEKEEELPIQGKNLKNEKLQTKSTTSGSTSMPQDVLAKMENSFGTDFSNVNIHTNDQSATQMGALAYTQGNDVHFAPGQYNPDSRKGQALLGHELTHVVQQRQGKVQPTKQGKGISVNNSPTLEKEADEMGIKAAAGLQTSNILGSGSGIQMKDNDTGRKLNSNQPSSIKTGTNVTYSLEQLNEEVWSEDSHFSYHWIIESTRGTKFIDEIINRPSLSCYAQNPGDYYISVQLLNNGVPEQSMKYTISQNVYSEKKNTELGMLSVGNFDFKYDGNSVNIDVRVKFNFDDSIEESLKVPYKNRFFSSISSIWGSSGKVIEGTTESGVKFTVPVHINCTEVNDNSYHKIVNVAKDDIRECVIAGINLDINSSNTTIAHEFGHVLGLYDEYDGGMLENAMFWHDDGSHIDDTNALMNSGTELRDRYFSHYVNEIQSTAPEGYTFEVK